MKYYIVGRVNPESLKGGLFVEWEFMGLFDNREKAIAHCYKKEDFIGKIELNKWVGDKPIPWPGGYYPLGESK